MHQIKHFTTFSVICVLAGNIHSKRKSMLEWVPGRFCNSQCAAHASLTRRVPLRPPSPPAKSWPNLFAFSFVWVLRDPAQPHPQRRANGFQMQIDMLTHSNLATSSTNCPKTEKTTA